jgi:[protein-PII] uridylyltransferase
LIEDDFRKNTDIAKIFKTIVSNFHNLGKTFFAMHEAKFFDAYIPEFRHLRNRVQHDLYHVYTVDTHSIFALNELSKLHQGDYDDTFPLFKSALQQVQNPDILSLGLLFHDIGKGMGGNHSVKGAQTAQKIAKRLGYDEKSQDDIEFLVLAHLLLSHISQRRDLEDPHLIQELALTLKTSDRLNMLFVLTWADIRAVSQEAWTEWKGTLLKTLYQKTKEELKSANTSEQIQNQCQTLKKQLTKTLTQNHDMASVKQFLNDVTTRYLLAHNKNEIIQHFTLIENHKQKGFFISETQLEENHFTELLIFTYHNPRVLSLITAVMLTLDINILALDVFSLSEGFNLIKVNLQSAHDQQIETRILAKLKALLTDVFSGKTDINKLLQKHKKPAFLESPPVQNIESSVVMDNDVSPYYTVIDVYTHDRVGLLYEIVRALADEGCYVEVSKISTKVDQVVDTFYVKDIFGHKISKKSRILEIQNTLLKICQNTPN